MNTKQINTIISKHFPKKEIYSTEIIINKYNKQIEKLKIIFANDFFPPHTLIGHIAQDIDNLTTEDEYGDLTEFTFKYSTFEEPIENDLLNSWEFNFNIDS